MIYSILEIGNNKQPVNFIYVIYSNMFFGLDKIKLGVGNKDAIN